MATIVERNNKYCVVYYYVDSQGERKQKWETYPTKSEAKRRMNEVEYKQQMGSFVVKPCKNVEELIEEYIELYGKENWGVSTFDKNCALINNYIIPNIGKKKLEEINTRFLENFYKNLRKMKAVPNMHSKDKDALIGPCVIRDIHKILKSAFKQAVKWELMEKNPAIYATSPKYKAKKRNIWTVDTFIHAIEVCESERLRLALNLAFSASLRMGEMLGLTWDCVDVSDEAIANNNAYVYIDKEIQRVRKDALNRLNNKDILFIYPEKHKKGTTALVLKTPKTESSVRKVYLPKSVALLLREHKEQQEEYKDILGGEYQDYNLVMCSEYGMPTEGAAIRKDLDKLIKEHDLPKVVFHSLRHTSVTYKLKLNGGDVKAVQGDSGHSQADMVTEVYSHIIDEDRKQNAIMFEEAFYGKKNLDPQIHEAPKNTMVVPDGVDVETLTKLLNNPEMINLLTTLAKNLN